MEVKFDKLKSYRVRFGYTQEDFGKIIGCNAPNYSCKESGNVNWFLRECCLLKNTINKRLREVGETEMLLEDLFPEGVLFAQNVSNMKQSKKRASPA